VLSSRSGISVEFSADTISNIEIDNNVSQDHCWGISVGAGSAYSVSSGVVIHHNTVTDWTNWQYPVNAYHTDGIIVYGSVNQSFTPTIHSNYIYGDLGSGSPTAFIYTTTDGNSASSTTALVYNNVLLPTTANSRAIWIGDYNVNSKIFNNTIKGVGSITGSAIMLNPYSRDTHIANNIFVDLNRAIQGYRSASEHIAYCDYNLYYNTSDQAFVMSDGRTYYTYAKWQGAGFDQHGVTASPDLTPGFEPSTGTLAVDGGKALDAHFNNDRYTVTRPQGAAWDIGAVERTFGTALAAPENLRLGVGQ
jgi:hypothetical protein